LSLSSIDSAIINNIFFRFFNKRYINKINNRNNINKIYNKNFEKFERLQKELLVIKLII
jgi:hypothetical protein